VEKANQIDTHLGGVGMVTILAGLTRSTIGPRQQKSKRFEEVRNGSYVSVRGNGVDVQDRD